LRLVDHLNRIDHHDGRLNFVDLVEDSLDVRLGQNEQIWRFNAKARSSEFGLARGFASKQILKFTEDCLGPVAGVLLVVGAGGGFSRVLVAGGVGKAIAGFAQGAETSPLVLGWLVAMLIRVATGSATVAITTAAGIIAEYAKSKTGTNMELLVVAMGAGSLILSHLNDGGFWFVKEYFNLTVTQTLKTWTVIVTVASVVALLLTLLLNKLV
jgi:GntP family gluconate:H+ symporter